MPDSRPAKTYYSNPDTASIKEVPQPVQHLAIANMAETVGGKIVFYTMEDFYTLATQEVIRQKLAPRPPATGVIFYRLSQFYNGRPTPNIALMREFISAGYEIHFARERISIRSLAELESLFPVIYATHHVENRDGKRDFFNALLDSAKPGAAR